MDSPVNSGTYKKTSNFIWDKYNGGVEYKSRICPECNEKYIAVYKHGKCMQRVHPNLKEILEKRKQNLPGIK